MKQEAKLFTVNDLKDVYDFATQYIEQDCRIVSLVYDGNKTALLVYEYEVEAAT